ncbi:tetratricopeptide repeat protein [Candidatus Sororendozoicomonas aggregata]|uniref:tetratricopeptide repeat protein n=1 Tax=Candidatus Sororendozoicomonas aggregata TaxID=3073239 RepID=UPI002ED21250
MKNSIYAVLVAMMLSGCAATDKLAQTTTDPVKAETEGQAADKSLSLYDGAWEESVKRASGIRTSTDAEYAADRAMGRNNLNKAAAYYARAFELDKRNAKAGYKLAQLHQKAGNTGQAEQIYRFVLKSSPRHIASLEGLGLIVLGQDNRKEARRLLVKAVAVFQHQGPTERSAQNHAPVKAFNGLGQLADIDGQFQQAQTYYQQGLQLDPGNTELMNNQAYSLFISGNWQHAERLLRDVLSVEPQYTRAIYNLALVNAQARRFDEVADLLGRFMEPYEASNDAGYLAMMAGDLKSAEALFQKAIDQAPFYNEAAWRNMDKVKQLETVPHKQPF